MMLLGAFLLGFPLSIAVAIPRDDALVSYDGFKVFRITTGDALDSVQEKLSTFATEPWNRDVSQHIDVALSPDQLADFAALGLDATIMHEDLGADIAAESALADGNLIERRQSGVDLTWFNSYHAYDDHIEFLENMQASYPNQSEIITAGESVQGRTLTGIHIWGSNGKGSRPAILFHGTVHAREWISTMTTEYIATQLLVNDTAQAFLDNYDFYIMPVVNPDGFVYIQTTNRLWRKNRTPAPSGSRCLGVDVNRNWPYQWDVSIDSGRSRTVRRF
jgi:hypothetical protein